jgi:transcriptional regulator with XRE-family HTH domain
MIGYGVRLRELRSEKKLTMDDAAKIVGVAKSTYAGYESEFRQPSLDKITLFADFYQVSVDYLLGLTRQRDTKQSQSFNAKELLSNREFHWDGVPLGEEEMKQIRDLLRNLADKNNETKIDKKFG